MHVALQSMVTPKMIFIARKTNMLCSQNKQTKYPLNSLFDVSTILRSRITCPICSCVMKWSTDTNLMFKHLRTKTENNMTGTLA